jgi:transcription initiation factor TFIIB
MTESKKKCPECGMNHLSWNKDKGEITCQDCGLVVDDKLFDFGPEWREHDASDVSKRRTGAPITYLQPGVSTEVGNKSDLYSVKNRSQFFRLRKWQRRSSTSIEQNLSQALTELKSLSSTLSLPKSAEEEAARIYTLALQRGLVKGRGIEKMVAGSIHAACKLCDIPKTMSEIATATEITKKDIGKTYRFITRSLQIKILPTDPISFLSKFSSALNLSHKTQTDAMRILERAQKHKLLSGKSPNSIAVAALYVSALMNKEKRTQQDFANVARVTEVTLRNRYRELITELGLKCKKRVKKTSRKKATGKTVKKASKKTSKKVAKKTVKKSVKSKTAKKKK